MRFAACCANGCLETSPVLRSALSGKWVFTREESRDGHLWSNMLLTECKIAYLDASASRAQANAVLETPDFGYDGLTGAGGKSRRSAYHHLVLTMEKPVSVLSRM